MIALQTFGNMAEYPEFQFLRKAAANESNTARRRCFMSYNAGDIIFQVLFIALLVVFAVSFVLFIRRLLVNSSSRYKESVEINQKLDKIMNIVESDRKDQSK